MEAISLANRKQELSRRVLAVDDPNILDKIESILNVEPRTTPMPCTYSIEEAHAILQQTSRDALHAKGRTWDEVKRYIHGQA